MKWLTSLSLATSLVLCFAMVWLLGQVKIPHQTRKAQLKHVQEMQMTTTLIIFCLGVAGVSSVMVVRKARDEYHAEATQNMQALIEQTKRTQQNPPNE